MKIKNILFLLFPIIAFSQESMEENIYASLEKTPTLETLKASFVNHSTSTCIDSRWMEELSNQELFDDMYKDISELNIDESVAFEMSSDVLKKRLKRLDDKSPFNIE
jgi:membrane-bound lytic murein transglycosylase D